MATEHDRLNTEQRRNRIALWREMIVNPDPEETAVGLAPNPADALRHFEADVREDSRGMRLSALLAYAMEHHRPLAGALSGVHNDYDPTVPWTPEALDAVFAAADEHTVINIVGRSIGHQLVAAINRDLSRGHCDECLGIVRHETHCSAYDASKAITASAGGWPDPLDPRGPND